MKNFSGIVIIHVNINSLRNKSDLSVARVKGDVNILVVSETKLENSFPVDQFKIPNYASPYRIDLITFVVVLWFL